MSSNNEAQHIPVLLDEVLTYLSPKKGESFLDLTAGYGGHAKAILDVTLNGTSKKSKNFESVLVDRDHYSIKALRQLFSDRQAQIIHKDFLEAASDLKAADRQFDMILADLGVSSPHLDTASRGFAFSTEGPLDMRMDQRQAVTADEIVNSYSEAQLVDIIRTYGEEPKAKKIAKAITEQRPITNTTELANIIARALPRRGKVHPATRTFQAIRIAVNDELDLLERALPIWIDLLAPGGRIAVISFHSLEDRIVKKNFADRSKNKYEATLRLLTKGPVSGTKHSIVFNPRERSAKLRAAVKIKNK